MYNLDLNYHPYDTVFAKYGVNAQGGGSGSIDKSLSLLVSVLLGGSTETFILPVGSRIDSFTMSGKAGSLISFQARIFAQNIPIPSQQTPAGTFATSPTNIPLMFWRGGVQPITVGGTHYPVKSIEITTRRNLLRIPQPDSETVQTIIPQDRDISGTITIVWKTLDNYTRLVNDQFYSVVWTLIAGSSSLTLNNCRFRSLDRLRFVKEETLYESYSFQASTGVLT